MSLGDFVTPWWLLLGLAVAGLAWRYVWLQRQARRHVLRFANLEMLDSVLPRRPAWNRHAPPALLAVAALCMIIGLGGPTRLGQVPRDRALVMLVMDVSLSMQCTDVVPTRLAAAQDAAVDFARGLPAGVNLGLESFAGTAAVLVPPTVDRAPVVDEIRHLHLAESTATGDALDAALRAIQTFEDEIPGGTGAAPPAKIVLMSDGKQTVGQDEYAVAYQAAQRKIPISTISFGTPTGVITLDGQQVPVPVDDTALSEVADISGGNFYPARSNAQIHQVYDTLRSQLGYQVRRVDASKLWYILGTMATLVAGAVAAASGQRLPL